MRVIKFILLLVIFSGCYTQKRAVKDLNKIRVHYPELIQSRMDTVTKTVEIIKEVITPADTIYKEWDFNENENFDETVQDSTAKTRVIIQKDTTWKVKVKTVVFQDTILVEVRDTLDMIVNKTEYITKVEKKTPLTSKILIGALLLGLLLLIFLLLRRK